MKAIYVSVWDGGTEIRSNCEYNPQTFNVTDIESVEVEGLEILVREYIELPDGTIIDRENFTIDFDCDESDEPTPTAANTFNIKIDGNTHDKINLDDLCSVICNALNEGADVTNVEISTNNKYSDNEPILTAVSSHSDGRTYVIFKDGALKIIQQREKDDDAIVLYIQTEDMQIIQGALKPVALQNLEPLIDQYGATVVLDLICAAFNKKAKHIEDTTNDTAAIEKWDKADLILNEAGNKIGELGIK